MSEQNENVGGTQDNDQSQDEVVTTEAATPAPSSNGHADDDAPHLRVFATAEAAQAVKPEARTYKLFRVTGPDGVGGWTWANSPNNAVGQVAKANGWTATVAGKEISKDRLQQALDALAPEDRAEILAKFGILAKKAKKGS